MDVHNAGGGIHYTVDHTKRASEDELFRTLRDRLLRMFRCGKSSFTNSVRLECISVIIPRFHYFNYL